MTAQFTSVAYALAAAGSWGISDFVGGYTARRFDAFFLAALGHLSGTLLMVGVALALHGPLPHGPQLGWVLAAGVMGGVSLGAFYEALSHGSMGIAAPVTAVLSAGIPTVYGLSLQGSPGVVTLAGFALALIGIYLISRPEGGMRPRGVGLALLSGVGFALFFIFISKAGAANALWVAAIARAASFAVTGAITLLGWRFTPLYRAGILLGIGAGCIDVTGTFLFVRATQTGRLDSAVVSSSLYPAVTVLLAWWLLRERFTPWKAVGVLAALAAIPMIARA